MLLQASPMLALQRRRDAYGHVQELWQLSLLAHEPTERRWHAWRTAFADVGTDRLAYALREKLYRLALR